MSKKTIVFTFGRFQPPTTGHGKLFNAVISHAKSVGGEHRIYASQSFDGGRPRAAVKNPLQYNDKIRFLKQMFPQANIVKSGAGIDTFMDVLYDLEKRGYKKIHMIVGEDRVEDIQNTVDKYLNTGGENVLNLEEFKVVSAGHRDPEATGVEGMSASKLRAAVAANDFKLFKTGMPTGFSGARELFDAIAKGLAKPMKKSKKTINEKAPPDEKAERMISKAKESFQDRYGDNADSYLYGVAWKQYNKRHGIKTKTRLGEPIMEGAYQHSKGQLKQAIDGSETLIATLKRYLKTAKSAALKAEIENQIEFWEKNIADARVELGESITEGVLNEGKKIVQRYESGRVKLTRYQRICLKAYQASLRMLDINDLTKDERLRYEQMVAMNLGACKEAGMGREHGIKEERELGESIMEGGVKSVIEDFIYDLPKEAIEELKVIMKEKYGSSRTNKLIKIRGKYKLPTQVMGYPTVQLINDYFNTYFGAVNEEIELDEGGIIKQAKKANADKKAFTSKKVRLDGKQSANDAYFARAGDRRIAADMDAEAAAKKTNKPVKEEIELDEASDDTDIDMTQADFQKMIRSAYNKAYDLCKQGKDISKYKATITAQIESTEIREGILDDLIKNVKDMFKGGSSDGPRYVMTVREAKKMIATATQRGCDEGKKASKKRNLRTESAELSEASNTIPDSAIVVTQNLQKKTITFTWYDGNTKKWIEREVPQDEAPGFYTRAGTAMKTRKTDKYGNLLKAPLPDSTAKFEKLAKANEAIAADLIALFSKKPMGTPITIYGTKPNKKDEYELEIVKRMYQGDEAYTVKSSGRFVELRKSPTGLQIVDVKTKRIVLDKGNDATW